MLYIKTIFIVIIAISIIICCFSCSYLAAKYWDIVCVSADEFSVDPHLILAICEVESHFNPKAVSFAGAVGIMQIMPETAEWIASRLSRDSFVVEDLYDAGLCIRFGAYYLRYLSIQFDDPWAVIAAYNAGEGRVKEWLNAGFTVEDIPIAETKNYLKKVEKTYEYYAKKKIFSFN